MKTNGHCTAAGDLNFRQIFVDNPTFSRINDVCTFGGIKNGHNEEKDVSVDVNHGLVIVVVDGGQAFHVDVDGREGLYFYLLVEVSRSRVLF